MDTKALAAKRLLGADCSTHQLPASLLKTIACCSWGCINLDQIMSPVTVHLVASQKAAACHDEVCEVRFVADSVDWASDTEM